MTLLKLSFAEPRNGWLSVSLNVGSKEFEFSASDVPNNPVEDLCNALFDVFANRGAGVWWHLEPDGYYFQFSSAEGQVQLRVFFARGSDRQQRTEVASVCGSKEEILLPLWRALRKLQSLRAVKPHWSEVRYGMLESFGEKLRASES